MERNPLSDTVGKKAIRYTVRELIEHLQQFDPEMQVVYRLHSDVHFMDITDVKVVQGAERKNDDWVKVVGGSVQSSFDKLDEEEQRRVKGFLQFPGN